jgi:hypothetical protein
MEKEIKSRIRLEESKKFDFPTYYDIKYSQSSKIFESEEIKDMTPDQIQEAEKTYYQILEKLNKGEDMDEGFLGAIAGAGASALVGPSIMKALCKALGIDENGTLGKLLTSKLVLSAITYTALR